MIICPDCSSELIENKNGFSCKCGYFAENEDGVILFHPKLSEQFDDYPHQIFEDHYQNTSAHFWFRSRKKFLLKYFNRFVNRESKVIELGAGTGDVSRELKENGYNICVGEVHKSGLIYAKSYGITKLYQFDIRKAPFKEEFDAAGIFDVIQHIEEDMDALKKIHSMLRSGGVMLLTTSAHKWLWSNLDDEIAIKRRYEKKEIVQKCIAAGFEILVAKHFFVSTLPLIWLRTIGYKKGKTSKKRGTFKIHPFVNFVLYIAIRIENFFLAPFSSSYGSSILIVAKKG